MRTLILFVFVVGVLGAAAMIWVGLRQPRDSRNAELQAAPGYDLQIPDAELLWDHESTSTGGHGATRIRGWGVHIDDDEVAAYFDRRLTELGYRRIAGRRHDPVGRSETLGVYSHRDVWFQIEVVRLPRRIPGGHVIRSGFEGIVYATISNRRDPPPEAA